MRTALLPLVAVALMVGACLVTALRGNEYGDNSVECLKHEGTWVPVSWLSPGYCKR